MSEELLLKDMLYALPGVAGGLVLGQYFGNESVTTNWVFGVVGGVTVGHFVLRQPLGPTLIVGAMAASVSGSLAMWVYDKL